MHFSEENKLAAFSETLFRVYAPPCFLQAPPPPPPSQDNSFSVINSTSNYFLGESVRRLMSCLCLQFSSLFLVEFQMRAYHFKAWW